MFFPRASISWPLIGFFQPGTNTGNSWSIGGGNPDSIAFSANKRMLSMLSLVGELMCVCVMAAIYVCGFQCFGRKDVKGRFSAKVTFETVDGKILYKGEGVYETDRKTGLFMCPLPSLFIIVFSFWLF